ncbi:hypothetical protein GCM10020229_71780 [Kitasatospora albolonga]|uniref:hypothetical protein n=1 Tax=Kitasatospora albolonga TaxID=68173 RepID=UPI0031EE6A7C
MSADQPVTPKPALGPVPTETPECEASTTHAISVPERVELHDAWPGWIPVAVILLMALTLAAFAIGRVAG